MLYLAFKGHNISLSRRALFFLSNIQCNSICCNFCFVFFFPCTLLSVTVVRFFTFYITIASVRDWRNIILFFLVFFLCLWTSSTVNSFPVLIEPVNYQKKKKRWCHGRVCCHPPLHMVSASGEWTSNS